ncbi:hypothetical protein SDC9_185860 [bioreactor metagenome]|uniref:Uncharacterized protein n=1 Tax=bioreactor metagenome TaxID=1076179 RepID=A0A645HIA9_9ZZZZ
MWRIGKNIHGKSVRNFGDFFAYGAEADDTECFAGQFGQRCVPIAETFAVLPIPSFDRR